ncbi:secretion protein EccK [Mycolicibacterium septicum]|uniref:Secretion protein EccK n=2 Tax=Mycolicibacterium septicum TaxID=98668 RepID=A0ABW9LZL6_9MYCO
MAPSPAVPASDAMAPASTSAPLSQAGAPASAAPVQAPSPGGSMGGMGMGGGMPMGAPPLGPPPTAPPAAPVPPAAAPPPAVTPAANVAGGAQVAPIPVSAARAQRDAAQDAAKRSGSDPLVLARRIAAALNAPDMVDEEDFIFFWITAVTVDGKIVVANNYGLAFIPEQVQLPEHVAMATADESIPPAERASWVTHPIVAVQRWAQHHDMKLRAVIATEDQFKNSDAGVHQEVLTPEDIPAKGQMAGRDRLKVIAPQIATRLAQISDGDLVKILPPAPVDTNPPEDRRLDLWDAVWQPLCSGASNRGQVHLQAFLEYASHAQEWAVYEAHAAGDGPEQRRAVADFIYWQHIGQLVADALAE